MKIIFAGTPDFAVAPLAALLQSTHEVIAVYTQPDRPAGRGRHLQYSPVKELAIQHHIPVYQPLSLRDVNEQKILRELNADIMVVVAYGLLLPKEILTAPRFGCINLHASLLPRWRGAAPIQRAILAGDKESGVTLMQMDEGLDTGAMLQHVSCMIENTDTCLSLRERLTQIGTPALLEVLEKLAAGSAQAEAQNNSLATYAKKITKEEAVINWQLSAMEIDRAVRAYYSWPVAHTIINEHAVKIWQASVLLETITDAEPGTIIHSDKHGIDVATGQGVLRLLQIQLPNARCLPVADVLNAKAQLFAEGNVFR